MTLAPVPGSGAAGAGDTGRWWSKASRKVTGNPAGVDAVHTSVSVLPVTWLGGNVGYAWGLRPAVRR